MTADTVTSPQAIESVGYSPLRDKGLFAFAVLFLLLFAFLLQFTLNDLNHQALSGERQSHGIAVNVALRDLLSDLQDGRGLAAIYLGGDTTVIDRWRASQLHMRADIDVYMMLIRDGEALIPLVRRWKVLAQHIEQLPEPRPGESIDRSFGAYTAVIGELLDVMHYVAEGSGLDRVEDYHANHLVRSVFMPMPALAEYVARLRGLAAAAAARGGVSASERQAIVEVKGAIKAGIDHAHELAGNAYEQDERQNVAIKPYLDTVFNATNDMMAMVDREILGRARPVIAAATLFDSGGQAIDAYLKFFDKTVSMLDAHLKKQADDLRRQKVQLVLFSCLLLLLIVGGIMIYTRARKARGRAECKLLDANHELALQKLTLDEHAIVSMTDRRGIITYVNSKFCAVSQYAADELLGQDHRILNSGYHPKEFFRELWATISSGRVWHGEVCNRRKDGELYWVQSTIVPYRDTSGRVNRFVSVRTDITAQKHAEQHREQRALRLRHRNELLHELAMSTLYTQGEGRVAFAAICRAAAHGLDVPRVGLWLFDENQADLDRFHMFSDDGAAHGGSEHIAATAAPHFMIVVKSGRIVTVDDAGQDPRTCELVESYLRPLDINSLLIATVRVAGRVAGMICCEHAGRQRHWDSDDEGFASAIADMTALALERQARHRAEFTANARERRFVSLVESMTDVAWEIDTQGRITYCSGSLERILGYRPDEVLGRTLFDLMSPGEGARVGELFAGIAAGRQPIRNLEHVSLASDGRLVYMVSNGVPLLDAEGSHSGYLCVSSDITARIVATQEMKAAHEAVLRASQAKSEFLAMMSHEIRTPMNGVMGMLQLLQTTALDTYQRDLLDTARESSALLLKMLNTILDFSKAVAGRIDLDIAEFNPGEFVVSVVHPFIWIAQERGLSLQYTVQPDVPQRVCGDSLRLRQVLTNLISNALKFTEDGSITVRVAAPEQLPGRGRRLRFEVTDTGIGVSSELQTRIFDAFEQADCSTTRRYGGTGLGLALCKQLIERMGGEINMESRPGEGSTFWFEVPVECRTVQDCADVANGGNCGAANDATSAPVRRRVLVVDDNRVNRRVAVQMLERLGYAAEEATGGEEALARVAAQAYDLMLLDCQMPDMDGYQVAMRIRASGAAGQSMRIIAMTADAMVGTRQRCLDAGMDEYLSKPLEITQLDAMLQRFTPKTDDEGTTGQPSAAAMKCGAVVALPDGEADVACSRVAALRPLLGAAFGEMLAGFVDDTDSYLATMQAMRVGDDGEALIRAAHALKGSSGNIGITSLSHCCEQVLKIARGNARDTALPGAVAAVAQEWARLRGGLQRMSQDSGMQAGAL